MNERQHFIPSIQDALFKPSDGNKKDSTSQVICQYLFSVSLSLFFSCWGIIIYCHSMLLFLINPTDISICTTEVKSSSTSCTMLHCCTIIPLYDLLRRSGRGAVKDKLRGNMKEQERCQDCFLFPWQKLRKVCQVQSCQVYENYFTPNICTQMDKNKLLILFHVIYWTKKYLFATNSV